MVRDWWMSIRFICFVFQGSLLYDRPVSGNNRLVKFTSRIFLRSFFLNFVCIIPDGLLIIHIILLTYNLINTLFHC